MPVNILSLLAPHYKGPVQMVLRQSDVAYLKKIWSDPDQAALHPVAAFCIVHASPESAGSLYVLDAEKFISSMEVGALLCEPQAHEDVLGQVVEPYGRRLQVALAHAMIQRTTEALRGDLLVDPPEPRKEALLWFWPFGDKPPRRLKRAFLKALVAWRAENLLEGRAMFFVPQIAAWFPTSIPEVVDPLLQEGLHAFTSQPEEAFALMDCWRALPVERREALLLAAIEEVSQDGAVDPGIFLSQLPDAYWQMCPTPAVIRQILGYLQAKTVQKPGHWAQLLFAWGNMATPTLIEQLAEKPHPGDAILLAALMRSPSPEALAVLVVYLSDKRKACRDLAMGALLNLGPQVALRAVLGAAAIQNKRSLEPVARLLVHWLAYPEAAKAAEALLETQPSLSGILGEIHSDESTLVAMAERCVQQRLHDLASLDDVTPRGAHCLCGVEDEVAVPVFLTDVQVLGKWDEAHQKTWFDFLEGLPDQEMAGLYAALVFCRPASINKEYTSTLLARYPECRDLLLALWSSRDTPQRAALYRALCTLEGVPTSLHLKALEEKAASIRNAAVAILKTSLSAQDKEALSVLSKLQKHPLKGTRTAARGLVKVLKSAGPISLAG